MQKLTAAAWAMALLVAGCTPVPPLSQAVAYRAVQRPIYSTAALPVLRLLGEWRQVAGFGAPQPCIPRPRLAITANAQGMVAAQYDLCLGPARVQGAGNLASAGAQGRYHLPGVPAPVWVLWIDQENRILVIGTPDGRFGMILTKGAIGPIPRDKWHAARDVLAWNGYDLTQFYQY